MSDLFNNYIPIVEQGIGQLGIAVESARTTNPHQWKLHRGSADIMLFLRESGTLQGVKGLFVVIAPIMQIPVDETKKQALYADLLTLSHEAPLACFSISSGFVYLRATRFVSGMDATEVMEMIDNLSYAADYIDGILIEKYADMLSSNDSDNESS